MKGSVAGPKRQKEDDMKSITATFTAAARGTIFGSLTMLFWAVAIIDDTDQREKKRRKKNRYAAQKAAKPRPHKPPGPVL